MPLFGDQDCMIFLLFNRRALVDGLREDPLDPHAVIIPQREINAYDALNAHHMRCDAYSDGDLLVTFPGCKDPRPCNPLFRLAAAHAVDNRSDEDATAAIRLFGPPSMAA